MRIDADASKPDYRVGEFEPRTDVSETQLRDRAGLLRSLDGQARKFDTQPAPEAMGAHYDRAFSLLSTPAAARAFDISREPRKVRERYGMNPHGQSVLQARRLVEAGVPLVTVFWPNDGTPT